MEVWRGPQYVDQLYAYTDGLTSSSGATLDTDGDYYWCSFDGFGTFRLGPSQVDVYDYTADTDTSFTGTAEDARMVANSAEMGLLSVSAGIAGANSCCSFGSTKL